jgi:hypothetical protein
MLPVWPLWMIVFSLSKTLGIKRSFKGTSDFAFYGLLYMYMLPSNGCMQDMGTGEPVPIDT